MSQEKIDQFYGEWYEHPDLKDLAPAEYAKRTRDVLDALDDYNRKDRPLNILAVHGSGRHILILDRSSARRHFKISRRLRWTRL